MALTKAESSKLYRQRRKEDPDRHAHHQQRTTEYMNNYYANNEAYRLTTIYNSKMQYANCTEEQRELRKEKYRERYANDPDFRERVIQRSRARNERLRLERLKA